MIDNAQLIKFNQVKMIQDRGYDISSDADYLQGKKVTFGHIHELNAIYHKIDDSDDKILVYYLYGSEDKEKKEYTKLVTANMISGGVIVITENDPKITFDSSPFNMWNIYYVRLLYNPTEHFLVPIHRKLSFDEKNELYSKTGLKENQLPILYVSDPISIWYGYLPGDVIITIGKYTVIPKTTESISYRVVKNI